MHRMKLSALAGAVAILLAACGGGSGGVSEPVRVTPVLSGTAAGGAPVIGVVTVKDSTGATKVVTIEADGTYSVDVSDMKAPFMVRATGTVGGRAVSYISAATEADVGGSINVTPFTTLMISNIAARLADSYFEEFEKSPGSITQENLNAARDSLQQKLAPALEALGLEASIDLLRASFKANHTGLDAALDLIKVSIDPATNIATLTNALTNATIGTDDIASRSDDTTPLTLSDAEKQQLNSGATDLQQVRTLIEKFVALFANGLPSPQQLENSGLFDTGNFLMSGANFEQFASDVSTEEELIGMTLGMTDTRFIDENNAVVVGRLNFKDGSRDRLAFRVTRSGANAPWRIRGDGRILDVTVESMSVYEKRHHANITQESRTSGIQVYAEVDYYQANNPSNKLTHIVVTGPGLPEEGVQFHVKEDLHYLGLHKGGAPTDGNVIYECEEVIMQPCVKLSEVEDNAEYTVVAYSADKVLNGSGYKITVPKAAPRSSELTDSMFPKVNSITSGGNDITHFSSFQPNSNVQFSWTMPRGYRGDWLNMTFIKPRGRLNSEIDIGNRTSATLAVEDGPIDAIYAHIWLSGTDQYGRVFVTNYQYYPGY